MYKKMPMESNAQNKEPLSCINPVLFYRKNPSFRSFYL
ncbi:hypothetical protein B4133_3910 [Bacillus altitudinis]|nr:hypothetical protein B4133_3910 [Bacillus altitudinis]